jgi:hypothetical protein
VCTVKSGLSHVCDSFGFNEQWGLAVNTIRRKVQGSRFKVQGSRFKVQGSGLKAQDSKLKV